MHQLWPSRVLLACLGVALLVVPCQAQQQSPMVAKLKSAPVIEIDASQQGTYKVELLQDVTFKIRAGAVSDRVDFRLNVLAATPYKVKWDPVFVGDYGMPLPTHTTGIDPLTGKKTWDLWGFVFHDEDGLWHLYAVTPGAYAVPVAQPVKGGK
jgi:hypothetical protein